MARPCGNPDGPGGYGAVLQFVDKEGTLHEKELSAGYVKTTNNRMELMAAIGRAGGINRPCEVELYSDSRYLVDAFNQKWIDGWVKHGWEPAQKRTGEEFGPMEEAFKGHGAPCGHFFLGQGPRRPSGE